MKYLFILFMGFVCLKSNGQNFYFPLNADSVICYERIINLNDTTTTKEMLYANCKTAIGNVFNSANNVIQIDDPLTGRLIAKGTEPIITMFGNYQLHYTLEILAKKGKYRYRFYDLYLTDSENNISTVTDIYYRYKHDQMKLLTFEGKRGAYKRYEQTFTPIDVSIRYIAQALVSKVENQKKSDEF